MQDYIILEFSGTQDKVLHFLNRADIFVLASVKGNNGDQEGIPNVLKESMSVGLPVISTHHAGIEELVADNISGFLVQERDVDDLAEKIELLIKYPNICRKMGLAGTRIVKERFHVEVVIKTLENIFYKLMKI